MSSYNVTFCHELTDEEKQEIAYISMEEYSDDDTYFDDSEADPDYEPNSDSDSDFDENYTKIKYI